MCLASSSGERDANRSGRRVAVARGILGFYFLSPLLDLKKSTDRVNRTIRDLHRFVCRELTWYFRTACVNSSSFHPPIETRDPSCFSARLGKSDRNPRIALWNRACSFAF